MGMCGEEAEEGWEWVNEREMKIVFGVERNKRDKKQARTMNEAVMDGQKRKRTKCKSKRTRALCLGWCWIGWGFISFYFVEVGHTQQNIAPSQFVLGHM